MNIKIHKYIYEDIHIDLPTHYNKHDIILNGYKYDIKKCVFFFLNHKIASGELDFSVDGVKGVQYMNNIKKSKYTILIGNMIKIDRNIYTEYLRSSIKYLESVAMSNRHYMDFKILKIYVDEMIVSKKLAISDIPNKYGYVLDAFKFNVFVKKLKTIQKQLYISDEKIDVNLFFLKDNSSMLSDLNEINVMAHTLEELVIQLDAISNSILSGEYPKHKLAIKSPTGDFKVKTYVGDIIYSKYINLAYDIEYYHAIFRELSKYLIISKMKRII